MKVKAQEYFLHFCSGNIKLDQLSLKVIDELKNKIEDLESKIDELILENTELKIKVARMEERLLKDVTKRTRKKRNAKPNP